MDAPLTEKTERKQSGLIPWKPGQSGNPAGRPKGARSKLGDAFLDALRDDFKKDGIAAIVAMRTEKPNEYAKMIAGLLPKEVDVSGSISLAEALDAIPDD